MSDDSHTQAPGPKAVQEVDDERVQTDEEIMLQGIAKQKELIDGMPGDTSDEKLRRAPHQKKLGQLEFQYHLSVEKKRLANELTRFEERYGAVYSEPCLLCLEDIHVQAVEGAINVFYCCGGFICKVCWPWPDPPGFDKCPLCREPIVESSDVENIPKLMAFVEKGVTWFQTYVGKCMIRGLRGFEKQEEMGLEWLHKAADQNHPPALYLLSLYHRFGFSSLMKSNEKANELVLKSASFGHSWANSFLAECYYRGIHGFEKDPDEAHFRASVAFALDEKGDLNNSAAKTMGHIHWGVKTEPSLYLALYYLNIAANYEGQSCDVACYLYSQELLRLCGHLHHRDGESKDANYQIPGFNALPSSIFWVRKSNNTGRDVLQKWEALLQTKCSNCQKKTQPGEKIEQCTECKAQWYCSKECQGEAWRAGHKKDCKRARILKFEDYLNGSAFVEND